MWQNNGVYYWLRAGKILVLLSFQVFFLVSCGYRPVTRHEALPEWVKNVYVEPFSNNSNELLLGQWITERIREELLRSKRFNLTSRDEADVVLTGRVEEVYSKGLSYVRYNVAVERRVKVKVSFDLIEPKTGHSLWERGEIVREEPFFVGQDVMTTQLNKDKSLHKISQDMAEILYHRLEGVF